MLRAGGAEASIASVQGGLVAATAWSGPEGRPGLALLATANRDGTGARSLFFLEPGRQALERLPEPPAGADALSAFDLDGDGNAELLVGAPGNVFSLEGGGWRKMLEAPGLGLLAPGVRPLSASWVPLAGAGRLELASRKAGGGLARGEDFRLPLAAERKSWGLRLASPPLTLLGAAGSAGPLFVAGPRIEGRRRLATNLLPLAGGAPIEAWSKLPGQEVIAEARYERWDGRPALLVASTGRLGISERKQVRIFLPAPDRTREGHAPVITRSTGSALWSRLDASLPDLDGDGGQDLALLYPEGLRGRSFRIEIYPALGSGRFAPRPRTRTLSLTADAWSWGGDFNHDAVPDLALLAGGKLQLHPGDARDRLPTARPAWAFPVAPLFPAQQYEVRFGPEGSDRPERERAESTWAERLFEQIDLTGDGHPEILLTGADHQGRVKVVVVRRPQ